MIPSQTNLKKKLGDMCICQRKPIKISGNRQNNCSPDSNKKYSKTNHIKKIL